MYDEKSRNLMCHAMLCHVMKHDTHEAICQANNICIRALLHVSAAFYLIDI